MSPKLVAPATRKVRSRLIRRDGSLRVVGLSVAVVAAAVTVVYAFQGATARAFEETALAQNAGYRLSAQAGTPEVADDLRGRGLPQMGSETGEASAEGRLLPVTVLSTTSESLLATFGIGVSANAEGGSMAVSMAVADLLNLEVGDSLDVEVADGTPIEGTVGRIFRLPTQPDAASVALIRSPGADSDVRWLLNDSDLDQQTIDSFGSDIRMTSVQWNAAQSITQGFGSWHGTVSRLPLLLVVLGLTSWWGSLVLLRRRWGRVGDGLLAAGFSETEVRRIFCGAARRVAVYGALMGILVGALGTWVTAPVLGAVVGHSWSIETGGRGVLSATLGISAIDSRTGYWLSQPLPRGGAAVLMMIAFLLGASLLIWTAFRANSSEGDAARRGAIRGRVHGLMVGPAGLVLVTAPVVLGIVVAAGAGQNEDGTDASYSVGRILLSAALLSSGLILLAVMTGNRFGPGGRVASRIATRWSVTTIGSAASVAMVCAVAAGSLSMHAAERTQRALDYRPEQPAGSFVATDMGLQAAQSVARVWKDQTGLDAWVIGSVAAPGGNVMASSSVYAQCLTRYVGMRLSDISDDACSYPRTSKSFPLGGAGVAVNEVPSVGSSAIAAEPELIQAGRIGLVVVDAQDSTIYSVRQVAAAPLPGLGGALPSVVLRSESVAGAVGLLPTRSANVVLPNFSDLDAEEKAHIRAASAPFTSVAASITEDPGPDGGLDGFTLGVAFLASLLSVCLVVSGAGGVVGSSGMVRSLVVAMGASFWLRWTLSARMLSGLLVGPLVGAGAAIAAILTMWSGLSLTDLGYAWLAPSVLATMIGSAFVARMAMREK